MIDQWRSFGVPSVNKTEQGAYFTSIWWQTMCASLIIKHWYTQAYHQESKGLAEEAGQKNADFMRCVSLNSTNYWVRLLFQVLDVDHDTPTTCALFRTKWFSCGTDL